MLFVIICVCNILGWYFTTEYSAQEVSCAFVILVAGRDSYLLTLPLCVGISSVRALSPAWTGSPVRETLISHTISTQQKIFSRFWGSLSSVKKIKYYKILTYILRSIFLEIPHLELPCWWKTQRDTNVNDIRLLLCLTPLQVNWVMEIN